MPSDAYMAEHLHDDKPKKRRKDADFSGSGGSSGGGSAGVGAGASGSGSAGGGYGTLPSKPRDPGDRGESHAAAEISAIVARENADKPKQGIYFEMSRGSMFPSVHWRTGGEAKAEEKKDEAEAARDQAQADRAEILGISSGSLVSAKPVLKELTEQAYYQLTPKQRAAVDFNTMLTTAVHKDKKRQDDYADNVDADERLVYDRTVDKMFGSEGGSELYAPETVAVLQQLKIKDPVADLDQYLNLSTAITSKDIKSIENPKIENFVNKPTPEVEREGVLATEITATQDLQTQLAKGKQMLQNWQAEAGRERALHLKKMGTASPGAYAPAPGYGGTRPEFEGFLKDGFDMLSVAKPGPERQDVLSRIKADMAVEGDDFSIFTEYVDNRTSNAKFYDAELGLGTKDIKYMPADRYRDLLGLNK